MKKIKKILANCSLIDAIGTIILVSVIMLILILFFFHSSNYIAHFSIASSFSFLSKDNYFIPYPEINFEKQEFKKQKRLNELFKLNIKKLIREKKSKEFYFDKENNFVYKNL